MSVVRMVIELEVEEVEMITRALNSYWRTALDRHEPIGQLLEKMTRWIVEMRKEME